MVFQGGFMVYHCFWLVSIVLLVENTTKQYPGPTIQSRPSGDDGDDYYNDDTDPYII